MSKTIRRKNETRDEYYYVDGWLEFNDHDTPHISRYRLGHTAKVWIPHCGTLPRSYVETHRKRLLAKLRARYHSDNHAAYNPPKWFRRALNQSYRGVTKAEVAAALRRGLEDELTMTPFKHSAHYDWD